MLLWTDDSTIRWIAKGVADASARERAAGRDGSEPIFALLKAMDKTLIYAIRDTLLRAQADNPDVSSWYERFQAEEPTEVPVEEPKEATNEEDTCST